MAATVANGPGNARDWVGLYPAGATSALVNRVAYRYLNGLTTVPASGVSDATITFVLPAAPGSYNVRFFLNNTLTVLATSGSIDVVAPPTASAGANQTLASATVGSLSGNGFDPTPRLCR